MKRSKQAHRTTWCPPFETSSAGSCFRVTTFTSGWRCCREASGPGWQWLGCCLRPSNTLLLDEPTNHLDLDSKDVLLEALEDYGGTLIFVSHDRYFVEKLATKIIEIGHGEAIVYPGTYAEFLWHKARGSATGDAAAATGAREPAGAKAGTAKPAPRSAPNKADTRT